MPTYEYRCPEGHEFEHFFSTIGGSKEVMPCPTCGRDAQRLVSGGAGLLFKGSGFYITDYGKDGKKSERDRAAKNESKSESKDSSVSSGEAKPPAPDAKPAKKPNSGE
ncbi:MAG TPA: zinc ribbon domain-containing protein [Gemmatimonadaceae bacterium]|jgi:putative FmdB family regulatory protein